MTPDEAFAQLLGSQVPNFDSVLDAMSHEDRRATYLALCALASKVLEAERRADMGHLSERLP
jgi:hypothetical protein